MDYKLFEFDLHGLRTEKYGIYAVITGQNVAQKFNKLHVGMSAEAKRVIAAEHLRLVEEMSLHGAVGADLEIRAVFPDGRAVKIRQFSDGPGLP